MSSNNTITKLAKEIEAAIISAPRDKGFVSASAWVAALTPVLQEYPHAISNMKDWLSQGVGKSSSGIAYKSRHNVGTFPPEQVFCNTRARARRPLSQVCDAVAIALLENVPYNPDRFAVTVSEQGLEQGLRQFNRTEETELKRNIYEVLPVSGLTTKNRIGVVTATKNAVTAMKQGDRSAFTHSMESIAKLLEDSEKRNAKSTPAPSVKKTTKDVLLSRKQAIEDKELEQVGMKPRKTRGKGIQSA